MVKIEQEARREKTDKSTVVRKSLAIGLHETRKRRALEDYRKGMCTIWQASAEAGISLREMMGLVCAERIPLHISPADVDRAWREAIEAQYPSRG
jgi:hypothetical protein